MVFKRFFQLSEYGIAQTTILLDTFLLNCYHLTNMGMSVKRCVQIFDAVGLFDKITAIEVPKSG